MNENGNEKCSLLLVLVFGACLHLLFIAFCCFLLLVLVFETESVLSQKRNRQMPLVARFVFNRCFHLKIALLVLDFCWYEKPKRAMKGKKQSKWKPGFSDNFICKLIIYK